MDLRDVSDGRATAAIEIGPPHLNPNGVVDGAVPFALVDTAMGGAAMSVLADGRYATSVELTTTRRTPGMIVGR